MPPGGETAGRNWGFPHEQSFIWDCQRKLHFVVSVEAGQSNVEKSQKNIIKMHNIATM